LISEFLPQVAVMASKAANPYQDAAVPEAKKVKIEGLGPVMSLSDTTYTSGAAYRASKGVRTWDSETPGFDSTVLPNPEALLGRWVRSPSKFVGWDVYMEFFGLKGDKALQETEEPQEHVILEFSKERLRILHRLCWRDGLDCEYAVPIDGSVQPIPPAMVARASSSWKVNDLACWEHAWDEGDGNPLHRGLRTQQKLCIGGTNYALRYWRNLIRPNEMRVNVEVTYSDTGKYAVHTQRFFRKIDVDRMYGITCLSPAPSPVDLANKVVSEAVATYDARGVRLVVLPHACNMPTGWTELASRWDLAEPFPTAGRSSGPFLTAMRQAAREGELWICCGVTLRTTEPEEGSKQVLRGVALIGADGWLHGVHTDVAPAKDGPYAAGTGEWPATQRPRPRGVYDTELGRICMCASVPDKAGLLEVADMGADILVVPPEACTAQSGASACLMDLTSAAAHKNLTRYELCGPEPLEKKNGATLPLKLLVASMSDGSFQAVPTCAE